MKKSLAAIALAGSIALIGSVPAVATTYPAPPANAAVSDGTVGPGEQFVFRGNGFLAGEGLSITVTPGNPPAASGANIAGGRSFSAKIPVFLAPQTFSATADANGGFAIPLTLGDAGTYTLSATGLTSGKTATSVITVEGTGSGLANTGGAPLANTGGGAALANTGADATLILWSLVGAGALAAGATSVVVVRRRAKAEAAA